MHNGLLTGCTPIYIWIFIVFLIQQITFLSHTVPHPQGGDSTDSYFKALLWGLKKVSHVNLLVEYLAYNKVLNTNI